MPIEEAWIEPARGLGKKDGAGPVVGWLRGDRTPPPVILDGDLPYAIVNLRAFLGRNVQQETKCERVALPVPCLEVDDDVPDVLRKFHGSLAPYLPVRDRGKLRGIVTAQRVLEEAFEGGPNAGDASLRVPVLTARDSLSDAMHAFGQTSVEDLPVQAPTGRMVGRFSRNALIRVQHEIDHSMGRRDQRGERDDLLREPVAGYLESDFIEVKESLRFPDLVETLQQQRTAFVRAGDGLLRGAVDAPLLLREAAEQDPRYQPARERRPPTPAGMPGQR